MSFKTLIVNNNVKDVFWTFNWKISGLWLLFYPPPAPAPTAENISTADGGQKYISKKVGIPLTAQPQV